MEATDVDDGIWCELPANGTRPQQDACQAPGPDLGQTNAVPAALRARARLAQAVALKDMKESWRNSGRRFISSPAPRLCDSRSRWGQSPLWLASCGGSRFERARAAEELSLEDFLGRPPKPCPPLRSI